MKGSTAHSGSVSQVDGVGFRVWDVQLEAQRTTPPEPAKPNHATPKTWFTGLREPRSRGHR